MKYLFGLTLIGTILLTIGCGPDGERNTVVNVQKESLPTENAPNSNAQPANATANLSSGPKINLTMEKYNRLKDGMSYEEVVKILGGEGTKAQSPEDGKGVTYKWEGEDFSSVFATFQNNKLTYKTSVGFK